MFAKPGEQEVAKPSARGFTKKFIESSTNYAKQVAEPITNEFTKKVVRHVPMKFVKSTKLTI